MIKRHLSMTGRRRNGSKSASGRRRSPVHSSNPHGKACAGSGAARAPPQPARGRRARYLPRTEWAAFP